MTTSEYTQTPIHIPAPLRSYTGGQSTINVKGESVGEALDSLTLQYPGLRHHLFDEDGSLRTFVNIYLNDEDIRYLRHTSTELSEDDELSIVPSIAGGCPEYVLRTDRPSRQASIVGRVAAVYSEFREPVGIDGFQNTLTGKQP